jgi:hypothetical protein
MKIGDLVKLPAGSRSHAVHVGLIVDLIDKKCWRTDVFGNKIDWNKVEPEPHAVVLINGATRSIPIIDLEVMNESW